jgi:hypothetical protein
MVSLSSTVSATVLCQPIAIRRPFSQALIKVPM